MGPEYEPASHGGNDTKEAIVGLFLYDLVGFDGNYDDAGADERDAQREGRSGESCGLHLFLCSVLLGSRIGGQEREREDREQIRFIFFSDQLRRREY